MAFEGAIDEKRLLRAFYRVFIVMMLGLFVASMLFRHDQPPLRNSRAFGCYRTDGAPAILLDRDGMTIMQPNRIRIGYHLERHKTGIALTAEAPIVAVPAGPQYLYSIRPPGAGLYLDFFQAIGGRAYGVFVEDRLLQFTMLARDGAYLDYARAPLEACRQTSAGR